MQARMRAGMRCAVRSLTSSMRASSAADSMRLVRPAAHIAQNHFLSGTLV